MDINQACCAGSYQPAIRRHPVTGAGECPSCGRRFDLGQLAGYRMNNERPFEVQNVPMHSPNRRP